MKSMRSVLLVMAVLGTATAASSAAFPGRDGRIVFSTVHGRLGTMTGRQANTVRSDHPAACAGVHNIPTQSCATRDHHNTVSL